MGSLQADREILRPLAERYSADAARVSGWLFMNQSRLLSVPAHG